MLAPLSWLKEYVDVSLTPEKLGERLTEVGLGCEKIEKIDGDVIFDLEITPNRPDCLSIVGIAREIAAIEGKEIKYPTLKTNLKPKGKTLPLKIHPNFVVTPRLTGIIINNVEIKNSPKWLADKLESIGQKPISNIVDVTNFVMKELGNPIHSFDYHKIEGAEMWVKQAKGGEFYESVDEISYHLPKGAIIYEDTKKIFDLVGIKGGKNSGTYKDTKAVFIVVEVDDPVLIRRASHSLALRSDASAIFERQVNAGGTIDALKRCVDLILDTAGGEIASELIDIKKEDFKPWKVSLSFERLNKILGIEIAEPKVKEILERLNLDIKKIPENKIEVTIPTYRNDLKIEEDIIEEVARLYGYNNFPKTLPEGQIPTATIPYFKDYKLEEKVKNIMKSAGFSEIYSYSLVSESDLEENSLNPDYALRVDNPVSREFEYLRPTLKINLRKGIEENSANFKNVNLFELGKVYLGKNIGKAKEEYRLSGISSNKNYYEIKGLIEILYESLGVENATYSLEILDEGVFFEVNYDELVERLSQDKKFIPVPKYPPITEDLTIALTGKKAGKIIETIKNQSDLIKEISLINKFEDNITLHIVYQNTKGNLTREEVEKIREKILKILKNN